MFSSLTERARLRILILLTGILIFSFTSKIKGQNNFQDSIRIDKCVDSVRALFNSDYNKAYNLALDALKRFKNTGYTIGKIRLLHSLAEINYYYKNSFDSSLIYLNRMKDLCDSIELDNGVAWYNLNLANIYYYQDDYSKAMQLYNLSKEQAEEIKDTVIIADALIGIGDILMQWGSYENALKILNEALKYAKNNNSLMGQFLLYDDIANIYKNINQADSSLIYYKKTLDFAERLNNTFAILVSELNVSYLKYKLDSSYDIVPELIDIKNKAKENDFTRLYIDAGFTQCEVLQDKGRYMEANLLYQEMFAVRDSVISTEGIRQVAEMESMYEIRQKEIENSELMQLNELNNLKLRTRLIIIFSIVFILIQAIVLLIVLSRKYKLIKGNINTIKEQQKKISQQEKELLKKEKESLELQLQFKEREHTSKAMRIFQFNQLNQKVIDELVSIKNAATTNCDRNEIYSRIQSMIQEMENSSNNQMWKEVETIFMESNPGYLRRLTMEFPNLSPNEIKLCVLLYMNLCTKDISAITKQSVKSINVARTRLRRKLHLSHSSESITSFLKQIG